MSPRTVRRYFGSKEQIVFARPHAILSQTERLLTARPRDEPVGTSLQVVTTQLAGEFEAVKEQWVIRRAIIEQVPSVAAFYVWTLFTMEDALRGFIADRLDLSPDDQRSRLASAITVATFRAAVETWLHEDNRSLADIVAGNHQAAITAILYPCD